MITATETPVSVVLSIIGSDWSAIQTAGGLRERLRSATIVLRSVGFVEMADKWEERMKNMPAKMGKESINYVLLSASQEVSGL